MLGFHRAELVAQFVAFLDRRADKDRKLSAACRREGELRGQLDAARLELDDARAQVAEQESRLRDLASRERDFRAQLKGFKDARIRLEDAEAQLGERAGSSSDHMRREAELRKSLREARIALDAAQADASEKDDALQLLARKEKDLRARLVRSRAEDTVQLDFQTQLADAEAELETLQLRLRERERALQHAQRREGELKARVRGLQSGVEGDDGGEAREKRHEGELRGLAKQISFLRARCEREEGFRKGLVWTKRWFLMQVEMYNQW